MFSDGGPGDRATRVLAYGLDLAELCKWSVEHYGWLIEGNPAYQRRLATMPKWELVEILLGLYECGHWWVDLPDETDPVDRAVWYVAREMNCFHKNVLEEMNGC